MRKICIALCISLFASLIHAGSMPASNDAMSQTYAVHLVKHDCHPQNDVKVEKSHSTSHQSHYQCCLGFVANLSSNQFILPDFANHFIPQASHLIVEAILSNIFKPPRLIS